MKAANADPFNSTNNEKKNAELVMRNKILVCMFLSRANKELYGDVMDKFSK